MAYEAMNHAGFLDANLIVVLNDNQQVSLPTHYNGQKQDPVGALSSTLARLQVLGIILPPLTHMLTVVAATIGIEASLVHCICSVW